MGLIRALHYKSSKDDSNVVAGSSQQYSTYLYHQRWHLLFPELECTVEKAFCDKEFPVKWKLSFIL